MVTRGCFESPTILCGKMGAYLFLFKHQLPSGMDFTKLPGDSF